MKTVYEHVALYLKITSRKAGIFLMLFTVAFSVFGAFVSGYARFFCLVLYSYLFACYIDSKIEERVRRNLTVSVNQIAFIGFVYLASIMVYLIFIVY